MSKLKTFILCICILYSLQLVLLMLTPDKFKKIIKFCTAVMILTVTVSNLIGIDYAELFESISVPAPSYTYDESDRLIISELESTIAEYLSESLASSGIYPKEFIIDTTIDDERCISITKVTIVLAYGDGDKISQAAGITKSLIGEIEVEVMCSEE